MKKFPMYFFMTSAWFVMMYGLFSGMAYKADLKIGYVHSTKIFAEHSEAIEAQKKIEAEQQQVQQQYQLKQEDFQKKVKQFENQSLMLSDAKKAEIQKELQDLQVEIYNFEQENFGQGGALETRWQDMMKPVVDKVQVAIDKIGTEQGYDIIFDTKSGLLLYANDEFDITEIVVEALNAN